MKAKLIMADEEDLNAFLATPGIKIASRHMLPAYSDNTSNFVLFFYETAEDDAAAKDRALLDQNADIERLIDVARDITNDSQYAILKNNAQREIYLLTRYNLQKSEAVTVSELLKPEMASVLGGAK